MTISTKGLDNAEVLAALYNAARPQGGLYFEPEPMDAGEARALLKTQSYFDYLHGRVMNVRIDGDELEPRLYDRGNGEGAAKFVIDLLRARVERREKAPQ